MNLIASIDENWGIGYLNQLLFDIPGDKQYFKSMTLHHIVVMGKNTLLSLPNSRSLPQRTNIVISKNLTAVEDALICNSVEQLWTLVDKFPKESIYVIGGSSIYQQLLPYCESAYITKFYTVKIADRYLTSLDKEYNWELVYESELQKENDLEYRFLKYRNNRVQEPPLQ